ncbi:MAG: ABC transporter substrate-binding protein [Chromatiales bacterium]|jgi:phospholipid transport system substrate-binding protein
MKQLLSSFLITLALVMPFGQAHAADEEIRAMAMEVSDKILARTAARRDELRAHPERLSDALGDLVDPYFDFTAMTQSAMGKYWPRASASEQGMITQEYTKLLVRTYGAAVLNYSGKPIEYGSPKRSKDGKRVEVPSEVTPASGQPVSIDYRMHQVGSKWKVYDVKIDGISLIANYRTSFASEIRKGGMSGLIAALKEKNRIN